VVPFKILEEEFQQTWITVDGIYPKYIRFVKGIKQPVTQTERRYTQWQEATRKDIERAFGVLKGTFQFLERPILLMDLKHISMRVTTCIILHNILVSDRVMRECGVTYNPAHEMEEGVITTVEQPEDLNNVQQAHAGLATVAAAGGTGIANAPPEVAALLTRGTRFRELKDANEYQRLHSALMRKFG
jgi:hypothetical protein